MVTHNPELADSYSTRIIKLKDGKVEGDTNPYDGEEDTENIRSYGDNEENYDDFS